MGVCSVRGLVDQIIIADTGSTDNMIAVARECGLAPWADHYAEAWNIALAPMTTDWVLVLDADEELPDETRHGIPGLLRSSDDVAGYLFSFAITSSNTSAIC